MATQHAFLLLAVLACAVHTASAATCKALALSGGGDKGAYEAGVLYGLTHNNLPEADTAWNVVTGISAGSIITSGTGTYAVGDEQEMSEFLVNITLGLTKSKVYKQWPGGVLEGLALKSGIYDSSPERALVGSIISRGFKDRRLTIGATDDVNGGLFKWNETQWQAPDGGDFLDGVMASSAIPGIFPSVKWGGQTFSDGGSTLGVNVYDAVVRCREIAADDSDITVDVVATEGEKIAWQKKAAGDTSLSVMMRNNDIKKVDSLMEDVTQAKIAYPKVNWRWLIYPSSKLPGNGLNFVKAQMEEMVSLGKTDALDAIQNQPRSCDYMKAKVQCTLDKDCFNWAAAKCHTVLSVKQCQTTGYCKFRLYDGSED